VFRQGVVAAVVVVEDGSLVLFMRETGHEGSMSVTKTRTKNVRFESAFESAGRRKQRKCYKC